MQAFLNSAAVKAALNRTGSPLAALTVLKKVHIALSAGTVMHRPSHGGSKANAIIGWVTHQVCDHPALLSENATRLVTSGVQRLARKQAGGGGARLGGFIVPDDESEESEASWSRSGSEEEEDEEEEVSLAGWQCTAPVSETCTSCMHDAGVSDAFGQVAPEAGGGGSDAWWDWAEGCMDAKLMQELGKKGASSWYPRTAASWSALNPVPMRGPSFASLPG